MANCSVIDWQGKEAGKATLDLKVAKESTAVDLMHRAVFAPASAFTPRYSKYIDPS